MVWAHVEEEQDDFFSCDDTGNSSDYGDEGQQVVIEKELDEDEDSDVDADISRAHGPNTTSERRRVQNEILRSYAATLGDRLTQKEVEEAGAKGTKDEQLSIRDILAKSDGTVRITNPRDYQTELFQRAKEDNIIAVLDTGSGKTHIATLLLRHTLEEELDHRAKGGVHRIAFFLVDSVNLVFQQANVLRIGLDQNSEAICGAHGPSLWTKSTWQKHFKNNMAIVCTAEVLNQCLMHSFINIAQINLLIFDEAHHAKNNHPYASLMREFYNREPDIAKRPRIFGMTASPVDVKGLSSSHIRQAARDLEKLLHSTIATTSDNTFASNIFSRPTEEVAIYARLPHEYETPFHQEIKSKFGDVTAFGKLFVASKRHGSELGRWASDMYWSFAFADEQKNKLQQREQSRYNRTKKNDSQEDWDIQSKRLEDAAEHVQRHNFGVPSLNGHDISSKVQQLHYWLNLYYERSDEARCIVFVEQRQTARLLQLIFKHIGGPNLHCDVLVGVNNRAGEQNISLKNQILTVAKFRRGELNCLFATSVAEEGLDIPQCNLVVRFDLYRTMIAYVQSRGRARHRNSKYLHMIEDSNNEHRERVMDVKQDEQVMRNFCEGLSHAQQKLEQDRNGFDDLLFDDKLFPSHTVPGSGAKLTFRSSLSLLNHFVATWPYPNHQTMLQPSYVVCPAFNQDPHDTQRRGFICEVILPEGSPIISVMGDVQSKKQFARCSSAFKMCLLLLQKKFLDDNLVPTNVRKMPAMANAMLAVSEKRKGNFPMLIKPQFWKQHRDTIPKCLYLTTIDADDGLDRPHQPLGLLTRLPLPQLPSFPIYLRDGRSSNIVLRSSIISLPLDLETLEILSKFTLRIYEDIYNKVYEYDVQKLSYWAVPILPVQVSKAATITALDQILDMAQIRRVHHEATWQWNSGTKIEELIDKYYVDPMNGGRRYYSDRLAPHLKPQDPVPAHVPKQNHKFMNSILDFTDSKWLKSRDISKWDPSQPVLEVEKILFRRNHLARMEEKEQKEVSEVKTYVCPQPLRISNLATPFVVMCYMLPAIIHRVESYLIALEASHALDLKVSPALALEALTKDSENTEEHGQEQIKFKSGMGPNYERLEFLGDCFLKMATSISVFVQQPDENEFEFHVRRMEMLCNKNLLETAMGKKKDASADDPERDLQIYKYIRTEAFSRRTWYPEGLKLTRGKGMNKSEDDWLKLTHNLGDKSIADVCESFIGATFMENHKSEQWNPSDWDDVVKAVKLFVNSKDHLMSKWSDYYAAYVKPKYQVSEATAAMRKMAEQLEKTHPYHFKYPRLARSAFTHPSFPYAFENIPNYQRLEFLGDSLLDMVFIMHLFYSYPTKDPQWLTEHKTPMVSNKFLGAVCAKLGWHTHLKQNTAIVGSQVRDYVNEVEEAEREAAGAVDYWVTVSEPPKCLADVVEAYVAALFVDAEFDFNVVQHFFDRHLKPFFVDMTLESYENFASNHPTTRLSRLLSINFGCSDWRLAALETGGVIPGHSKSVTAMVMIHNEVRFHSLGQSGRYARVRASQNALEKLDGLPPYEFRKTYGCDCVDEGEGEDLMAKKVREERIRENMGPNF